MEDLELNLSEERVVALRASENGDHVVFTSGNEGTFAASYGCDFSGMRNELKTELLLLVPNVNGSIDSSGVADTILIIGCAVQLDLVILSEFTLLDELLI